MYTTSFLPLRLEKEYTTIKTKEMEEQVEIKVSGRKQTLLWLRSGDVTV